MKTSTKPNALVFDRNTRTHSLERVEGNWREIWRYNRHRVACLRRSLIGTQPFYTELTVPEKMDYDPNKLWRALHWLEIRVMLHFELTTLQKVKVGLLVTLGIAMIAVIFLIVMGALG